MNKSQKKEQRNTLQVYAWLFLFALILAVIGTFHIPQETAKAILINLASDCVTVGVLFFIFNRVFLIDDERNSTIALDGISTIRAALSPNMNEKGISEEENESWLWKSIKDTSKEDPDERDRIKRIATKVDLLLSEDPQKSEVYRLRQRSKTLQKEKEKLDLEFRQAKSDWETKIKEMGNEIREVRNESKSKDLEIARFSKEISCLRVELKEAVSEVRTTSDSVANLSKGILHTVGNISSDQRNALLASSDQVALNLDKLEHNISKRLDSFVVPSTDYGKYYSNSKGHLNVENPYSNPYRPGINLSRKSKAR